MTDPELAELPVAVPHADAPSVSRPAPATPTRVRYVVLSLACAISFVLYLQRYAWGFVKKDVAKEFGWNSETLGWLDSLFVIPYGLGQIPSGMLCDWFGAYALLGSSIFLWSFALAGICVAGSLGTMAAARLAFGAAQASCYPSLSKASKNWFPLEMRTTAQSLIATFFGRGGGAASFFLFGTVMLGWLGMSWRAAVYTFSGLGILCGIVFLLLFRNTPREHPWANEAEADLVLQGDPHAAHGARSVVRWGLVARSRNVWLLLLRSFASNMADVVFVYWIPMYLLSEKQVDMKQAGWMSAMPLLGGAAGGLFSGLVQSRVIQRTGNRRWARRTMGLLGKSTGAGLILWSLRFSDPYAIVALLTCVKFFCDWEQPAEWGTISDIGGRSAATVFACVNTMGSFGGFVASVLNGVVLQAYSVDDKMTSAGWNAVFLLVVAEFLVASMSWWFIDCQRTIEAPQAPLAENLA